MVDFGRIANDWWDSYFLRDWSAYRPVANTEFFAEWHAAGGTMPFAEHFLKLCPAPVKVDLWFRAFALGVEIRHGVYKAMGIPWTRIGDFPHLPYKHFQPTEFPAYITPSWTEDGKRCDDAHMNLFEYDLWSKAATGNRLGAVVYGRKLKHYIRSCRMLVNCLVGQSFPDYFSALGFKFRPASPLDQLGDSELILIPTPEPLDNFTPNQLVALQPFE